MVFEGQRSSTLHLRNAVPRLNATRRTAGAGLAALGGAAWALAAPPRGWWPLLPLGVAALAVALHGRALPQRALFGAITGILCYAPTLWWLTDFSVPGYVAVTLVETGLLAGSAALVPVNVRGCWSRGWWSLPAALVLLEAVQTRFPFGGFPLPVLALSQPAGPFAAAAPVGGSLLVTASAAFGGITLAALVLVRSRWRLRVTAGLLMVTVIPLAAGASATTTPVGTLDVAVIQGGGPRGVRAVFTDPRDVTRRHLTLAQQINGSPDLVLLPENVVDVAGSVAGSPVQDELGALARRLNTNLVVGVTEGTPEGFRNAAVLWGPNGELLDRYEKKHRVPFGEYIPARDVLERVTEATALVPRDAIPGQGQALLRSSAGPLGVAISFEVFFADRVREGVTAGGQVVLVPTNAASYVTDEVPAMELAAARLRAREFGRTLVQAAPTGYSAVVLADGQVRARSELGTAALLREPVPLTTGLTPYARSGDIPLIVLAVVTLTVAPLTRWASRRLARSARQRRGTVSASRDQS